MRQPKFERSRIARLRAKHTPGPWTIGDGDRVLPTYIYADQEPAGSRLVACLSKPRHDANARLIAAAPEMFEILGWVVQDGATLETLKQLAEKAYAILERIDQ